MAARINGIRTPCDLLMEISYHLIEQVVNATITTFRQGGFGDGGFGTGGYGGPNGFVIGVNDLTGFYVGAQVVVGWNLPTAEVGNVIFVNYTTKEVSIEPLLNAHSIGETILAPTFPTQAPTDPLWTQTEMLGYVARAQNEFLIKCPIIYQILTDQHVFNIGQQFQTYPQNFIELERVALQVGRVSYPIATITRTLGGFIQATMAGPCPLTSQELIYVTDVADPSFNSISTANSSLFPIVVAGGGQVIWSQPGPNASSTGGTINVLLYPRLYETTQEQVANRDPQWYFNNGGADPGFWYEDRAGNYGLGLAPVPMNNYYAEYMASVRDTDTLGLLDGFLLPDMMLHFVKYKAMEYALTKDGEARSPSYAAYCRMRFDMGVIACDRYLHGFVEAPLNMQGNS